MTEIEGDLRADVERLRGWKAEASEVIHGLQDLGKALGLRMGTAITGASAAEAATRLVADLAHYRDNVVPSMTEHVNAQLARAESAEADLLALREGLEALADEWATWGTGVVAAASASKSLRALLASSPAEGTGERIPRRFQTHADVQMREDGDTGHDLHDVAMSGLNAIERRYGLPETTDSNEGGEA